MSLASFHEAVIRITAENNTGSALRDVARDVAALGASAVAVARLGEMFGVLDRETANTISTFGSFIALSMTVLRGIQLLSSVTSIATAVEWAFNASLAMQISLLTLGIGLIAVTAGYMGWLAATTRSAAGAMTELNTATEGALGPGRSITRAGEEEMYRRGLE